MKNGKNIADLRVRIDEIDDQLLDLLNRRAAIAVDVGLNKATVKTKVYAPKREREIYERLKGLNKGPLEDEAVRAIFGEIISASRSLEKRLAIAFLGPKATFTHQASLQHFGSSAEFIPQKEIADVFSDVERDKADFGVVPVENSTGGVVSHTLDMFMESDLKIYSEILLEISLALMNKSGEVKDIESVSSHPNPISQCRGWLKAHLPGVPLKEVSSTARAAESACTDATSAAIASSTAARIYKLQVIEKSIEDNRSNITRFLVIGKREAERSGSDKTSLMFSVKDSTGALYNVLKPFADRNINLTKIESRPVKKRPWEYIFFLDMDGHITDKAVSEAVSELGKETSFLKVLGSYPKSRQVF